MSGFFVQLPPTGGETPKYVNFAAFPSAVGAGNGALAIALDTDILYISDGTNWLELADPVITSGALTNLVGDVLADGPGSVFATINTGAVTSSKLATDAVTEVKIQDGAVNLGNKVSNVLPIANGGTAASTANQGLNNLLPTQGAQSGKFLSTNGSSTDWQLVDMSFSVTGVLPLANGGTASSTQTGALINLTPTLGPYKVLRGDSNGGTIYWDVSIPSFATVGNFPNATTTGLSAVVIDASNQNLYISNGATWEILADRTITSGAITSLTGPITATGPGAATSAITAGAIGNAEIAVGAVNLTNQVSNTLPLANGGTGQTSASAAINALVPSQGGNNNKALVTDGTVVSWGTPAGGIGLYANTGAFPNAAGSGVGAFALSLSTQVLYVSNGTNWIILADPFTVIQEFSTLSGFPTAVHGQFALALDTNILYVGVTGSPNTWAPLADPAVAASAITSLTGPISAVGPGAAATTIGAGAVNLTTMVTGLLPIANGGTAAGTAGGAINNLLPAQGSASSQFLTTNGIDPAWSLVPLTTGVSGILPIANGGTNATTAVAGLNNLLPTQSSNAGRALVTDGTNSDWQPVAILPSLSGKANKFLSNDGNSTLSWDAVDLANSASITGALPIANGGTGQTTANPAFAALSPMTTEGDIIYEDATPTPARLAGNTTTTKKFLTQTGTGSASAPPGWDTIIAADLPAATSTTQGAVVAMKTYYVNTSYANGTPTVANVSSLGTLTTNNDSSLVPYQTVDGTWHLKFCIEFVGSSSLGGTFSISGVTWKGSPGGIEQAISAHGISGPAFAGGNVLAGTANINIQATGLTTIWAVSGDVALNSKPTWAD